MTSHHPEVQREQLFSLTFSCSDGRFPVTFVFAVRRSAQCPPPLIRSKCDAGENGLECARTCQNLDLPCVSSACTPGCLCPPGTVGGVLFLCMCAERNKPQQLLKFSMLSDSFQVRYRKNCVAPEECPCFLNNRPYASGQTISVDCNIWYQTLPQSLM